MKTYTLLLWWEVPENLSYYMLPNDVLTDEQVLLLNDAHGHFVNGSNEDNAHIGMWFVYASVAKAIYKNDYISEVQKYGIKAEWVSIFEQYKVDALKPIEENITRVVQCGFFM